MRAQDVGKDREESLAVMEKAMRTFALRKLPSAMKSEPPAAAQGRPAFLIANVALEKPAFPQESSTSSRAAAELRDRN